MGRRQRGRRRLVRGAGEAEGGLGQGPSSGWFWSRSWRGWSGGAPGAAGGAGTQRSHTETDPAAPRTLPPPSPRLASLRKLGVFPESSPTCPCFRGRGGPLPSHMSGELAALGLGPSLAGPCLRGHRRPWGGGKGGGKGCSRPGPLPLPPPRSPGLSFPVRTQRPGVCRFLSWGPEAEWCGHLLGGGKALCRTPDPWTKGPRGESTGARASRTGGAVAGGERVGA